MLNLNVFCAWIVFMIVHRIKLNSNWQLRKMGNPKITSCKKNNKGISRRNFLFLCASSLFFIGCQKIVLSKNLKNRARKLIRPPGVIKEGKFLNRCVRCGNCMRVCITNGLQPIMFQAGFQALWTPQLVPEIGYCEYNCTLCGEVCPTGAIPKLNIKQKHRARLGIARINRNTCIPWSKNKNCIVCEEHCPIFKKAIKLKEVVINGKKILRPYVDRSLCVGCGICQNKCPVRPVRAIRVDPQEKNLFI